MTVYDVLFPPENKYKGMAHLAVMDNRKELKSLGYCYFEDLPNRIKNLDIMQSRNYYITANATKQYTKRCSDNLFSLNNIVLDFDIHSRMNQAYRDDLIEDFVWRIKRDLFDIIAPFSIPKPNVIHYTGRGVQLWWHIDSASSQLMFLYRIVIDKLSQVFNDFFGEYPTLAQYIEIDIAASKNAVGLFRLFDTYNTHISRKTETELIHTESVDLNGFNQLLDDYLSVLNSEHNTTKPIRNKKKPVNREDNKKSAYEALHRKRVAFIQWLSKRLSDSVGKRDNMIFLAYNAAIQYLSTDEAKKVCQEINESFSEPLESIEYIFKEIRTPYKISNVNFYERLGANGGDVKEFESEYLKKTMNLTRDTERKKNREERNKKKDFAKELLEQGMTYKQISERTGLSTSTIARLSAECGKRYTKQSEKPWETLGISRATYYRRMKKTSTP